MTAVDGTSTAARDAVTDAGAAARVGRLGGSLAAVRPRSRVDLHRLMLIVGSVLLPSGVIIILLGWYGASHTSYNFEQTDYLISGGILGAALTVAGGFLYFGYWLTQIVHDGRRQRADLSELLTRIDRRLAALEVHSNGTAPVGQLVSTATGSLVHRADCPLIAGRTGLRAVSATSAGAKPCKVCNPFDDEADR